MAAGQYEQAIGVTLEARRLDKLEELIMRSSAGAERTRVLKYALRVCQQLIISREFRQQVWDWEGGLQKTGMWDPKPAQEVGVGCEGITRNTSCQRNKQYEPHCPAVLLVS